MHAPILHFQPFLLCLLAFFVKIPLKYFLKNFKTRFQREKQIIEGKEEQEMTAQQRVLKIESEIRDLDQVEDFVKVSKLKRQILLLKKSQYQDLLF